jgi:hypothetical protein
VLTASLDGLDVFTASLEDLDELLLIVFPDSALLELPLLTELSLLDIFELLSE